MECVTRTMPAQEQVLAYLRRRNFLGPHSIVDGDLSVLDASRRNRNFKILGEEAPHYLVKQGVDPERIATIAHEAAVYHLLHSRSLDATTREYLPRFYAYDSSEHVLILEFFPDAHNLREYHSQHRRISSAIAVDMGHALGALHHSMGATALTDSDVATLTRNPPWVLFIHRPDLRILRQISGANIELIKLIQHSAELCEFLDAMRAGWRSDALIHFDIKFDNLLALAGSSEASKTRLKIIDWELAGLGDPCWDVGSVFMDYLSLWLLSIPITGETPPDRFPELATYPLERMQPAMRSFWHSYVRRMKLDAVGADEWLVRAVKYAAGRMVQTAFEQTQMSMQLNGNVICMLQVSLNMLRRPHEAILHLLGIPLAQLGLP